MLKPRKVILIVVLLLCTVVSSAQVRIGAEFRPRMEYRHGYRTLSSKGEEGIFLTTQRTRLSIAFAKDDLETYLSFQDLRVWGQDRDGVRDGAVGLYEGWFKWALADRFSIKVGRQEIEYDDSRLISISDWRVPARSHDALLTEWLSADSTLTLQVTLAINADREALFADYYDVNNYKNMQIIWLNKRLSAGEYSLVGLRTGYQQADTSLAYLQTVGGYFNYDFKPVFVEGSYYAQFGDDASDRSVWAQMISFTAGIKYRKTQSIAGGIDLLTGSGTEDQLATSGKFGSFDPVFARRHRMFGTQDMFYAGGFEMPAGLLDLFLKWSSKMNDRWKINVTWHVFNTQTRLVNMETSIVENEKYLGQEVDLKLNYVANKWLKLELGYSQFFASNTMVVLKQRGSKSAVSNFAYLTFSCKPSYLILLK